MFEPGTSEDAQQGPKTPVDRQKIEKTAVSDLGAIPLSLIESWLKIEADRGISEKWGPDSMAPPMGDCRIHQADELRAWWIVHCAFVRLCAPHEPQVLKSLVIHVHFHGRKPTTFWLSGFGVRGWKDVLERFYQVVHDVAAVTPKDKFWEEE